MAVPDTDDTNSSKSFPSSSPQAARPSWETAPRPAPAPQPAPRPAPPSSGPAASPYYAAPAAAPSLPAYAPAAPAPAAYVSDADVQYDLAGNPIPSSAPASSPAAAPFGYAAGRAAGSWPPPPTSPYGQQTGENGTDRVARLKWNWGAFFIPFWWSIFNGQKGIALAIFLINALNRVIPAPYNWGLDIASLGIQIYLGVMGHRLAWTSDRFGGDYDNFIRTQRAWMIWGFVVAGLIMGGLISAVVLIPGFLNLLAAGPQHHPAYTNSSYGNSTGQ